MAASPAALRHLCGYPIDGGGTPLGRQSEFMPNPWRFGLNRLVKASQSLTIRPLQGGPCTLSPAAPSDRPGNLPFENPVMPFQLRIGALVLAALLLLAALLGARIFGNALRTRVGTYIRAAAAVAGAVLIIWAVVSYMSSQQQPQPQFAAAASTSAPLPPTIDLIGTASSALAACPQATAPPVPDGSIASLKEMTAARTAFQAYDGATNSYLHCVDSAIDQIAKQFARVASQDDLNSLHTFGERAHDTAVDQEQAVADQFNSQIRTYKAKHPKS